MNATVFRLIEQVDTQDYEIHLVPVDINDLWLSIVHIKNQTVQEIDQVTASQILGKQGTWVSYVGRG
ncbi:MAG: hypothetical protein KJP06_09710 [Deltaproteobacteria bacterium]|nr:hypothetical protein [Deltaproteobacteria bacterium]